MQNNNPISKRISYHQTPKKLFELTDKLKPASFYNYAHIHAKGDVEHGELNQNGFKNISLIGLTLQDYSNGTGVNNIIVNANLLPEEVQDIYDKIYFGYQTLSDNWIKIFGSPNENGYSIVHKLYISRNPSLDNPWEIKIENGYGIKQMTKTGGTVMQSNSYILNKKVSILINDKIMKSIFKKADRFIKAWEFSMFNYLYFQAKQLESNYYSSETYSNN